MFLAGAIGALCSFDRCLLCPRFTLFLGTRRLSLAFLNAASCAFSLLEGRLDIEQLGICIPRTEARKRK